MRLLLLMYSGYIVVSLDRTLRLTRSLGLARRKRTGLICRAVCTRLYYWTSSGACEGVREYVTPAAGMRLAAGRPAGLARRR